MKLRERFKSWLWSQMPISMLPSITSTRSSTDRLFTDPKESLRSIAMLRAASLISGAIATLPINVYRRTKAKDEEISHHLEFMLNREANPEQDATTVRAQLLFGMLLWGNGFARKVTISDGVHALWPMDPGSISPRRDGNLEIQWIYQGKPYPRAEILHAPLFSLPGEVMGLSPVGMAARALANGQDLEAHANSQLRNGVFSTLLIEHPGRLSADALKNLRKSIEDHYAGPENSGKPIILEEAATAKPFSVNPKEAQFLEHLQYSDEKIAMLMGVPPHMLGLVSKSTSWGTGIGEQKQGFMDFTLAPIISFLESAMNRQLFSEKEKRQGLFLRHDLDAFMRADIASRFEAYTKAVTNGILTRNEVRRIEGWPEIDGAETLTVQQQNIPLSMVGDHLKNAN